MNSVLVENPLLARYFVDDGLLEWCDGWWMAFRFGSAQVLIKNEYTYFTRLWVWQMDRWKFFEYVSYADVMDILNALARATEEAAPSLADKLVVEGEAL